MVVLGGAVGVAALVAPTALQRLFGVPAASITGPGNLGWRLFAARNVYLAGRALAGDGAAVEAFGPLQALDQAVFWHVLHHRQVPRGTALAAIATSGAIVALDQHRRRRSRVVRAA